MKRIMKWMLAAILVCGTSVLTSCSPDNDDNPVAPTDEVEAQLQKMTLREKVGQLFYVRPECLDTTIHFNQPSSVDGSTDDIRAIKLQAVNATMKGVNEKYPVGGVILYAHNIEDEAQLSAFISQIRTLNGSPLLCIDEEGGRVARIANNANFEVEKFESMGAIGATGDPQNAYYCKAKVSSGMNRETAYIAHVFGFALPKLKSSVVSQTRLILTDHTDYAQCVEGAREAVVLQKIDHHVEGDIADSGIPFVRREMVGSTNTIIYEMYKEQGIAIDDETARIMLAGIISDTRNLSKTTTQAIDSTALQALTAQLAISPDSVARLNRGMEDAATDYTGMADAEIFLSDYKEYEIGGHLLGFGSLVCKQSQMEAFIDRMLAVMPEVMGQRGRQMLVAKIDNMVENTGDDRAERPYVENGTYFIYYGEGAKQVAEGVFGPSLREGVCYTSEELSRKQIVPRITEVLTGN